jgi:hypothetical protein
MLTSMVEVFKTNVLQQKQAKGILAFLSKTFPGFKINFDLDDCDKILRVEGQNISSEKIINLLNTDGYQCEVLDG